MKKNHAPYFMSCIRDARLCSTSLFEHVFKGMLNALLLKASVKNIKEQVQDFVEMILHKTAGLR